eukprot:TRINITY_DN5198_c0_g1_i2.p1 TRINITY_DN5198_c0_g1~~TRINITY_DN5198_c0_g1_i2.p1  ORF type:complete len:117 (+),score=40.14 TRINITY_DN5198_c0_g1_i2:143-493(+)
MCIRDSINAEYGEISSKMEGTATQVKSQDMNKEMLDFVITQAQVAIEKINSREQEAAEEIKMQMDKKYGPDWQCFVGRGFKACLTHETKHYAYFYAGALAVLIYRTAGNHPLPIGI